MAAVRKMCADRGIEMTNLKSKCMMNTAIIEHEAVRVKHVDSTLIEPDVGSAAVTPNKGKDSRLSRGVHGCVGGVDANG